VSPVRPTIGLLRIVSCFAVLAAAGCAPRLAGVAVEPTGPPRSAGAIEPIDAAFAPETLPRAAEFAGATFTVVRGEVTNIHPYTIFGEPKPGPELFGVLTVRATNDGDARIDYVFDFEAFRLRTYSGAVLETVHPVGTYDFSTLGPGAADLEDGLVFPLRVAYELDGAALLIGKPPDQPAVIELTAPPAVDAPSTIPASAGDVRVGPLSWTLLGGRMALDGPAGVCCPKTGVRANADERFVTLTLRAVVRGSRYGRATISSDLVTLLADGVAFEPLQFQGQANVQEGQSLQLEPVFLIDAAATTLQLRVGAEGTSSSETIDLEVTTP
jgi:hypothetical protein